MDAPSFKRLETIEGEHAEMAHALYTVALHLSAGATGLAVDRIRGCALRCPSLLAKYPALLDTPTFVCGEPHPTDLRLRCGVRTTLDEMYDRRHDGPHGWDLKPPLVYTLAELTATLRAGGLGALAVRIEEQL